MTLSQARLALSKYVDNGVCASDARVISRLNEAQRRLYAVRPWLGVMAKAICAVQQTEDPSTGGVVSTFNIPEGSSTEGSDTLIGFGFQSISRASEYVRPSSEANSSQFIYPYVKTNKVQAFVSDTNGVLQVYPDQSNPYRYVILKPSKAPNYDTIKVISFVEITGQLKFKPVVLETDMLLIDDADALKLMLLALWREENNQMDLAKTLEAKAIEHLTVKTESAIEAARKISYQTSLDSYLYGTMGFVRAKLALDLKGGLRMDDGELNDLISKSMDILVTQYNFLIRNGRYGVKENLPPLANKFSGNDEQLLPVQDYSAIKFGVLAVIAANSNQLDAYNGYVKQAVQTMEQALAFRVETRRHSVYQTELEASTQGTLGYVKAKLALEMPNGLSYSDNELVEMINKAQERLVIYYNTLIKSGRYGVKDELPLLVYTRLSSGDSQLLLSDYSAIRYEILGDMALVSKDPNGPATAEVMNRQAQQRIEEELMLKLETKRHTTYKNDLLNSTDGSYGRLVARLALELPDGLKISTFEIQQGIQKAIEKLAFRYNSLVKSGRFGVKSNQIGRAHV